MAADLNLDIQKGISNIFKTYKSIEKLEWKGVAEYNDNWYESTISIITLNDNIEFEALYDTAEDYTIRQIKMIIKGFATPEVIINLKGILSEYITHYFSNVQALIEKVPENTLDLELIKGIYRTALGSFVSSKVKLSRSLFSYGDRFFYETLALLESIEYKEEGIDLLQQLFYTNCIRPYFRDIENVATMEQELVYDNERKANCVDILFECIKNNELLHTIFTTLQLIDSLYQKHFFEIPKCRYLDEVESSNVFPSVIADRQKIKIRKWKC